MKTKLITALRLAANALEDGTFDYKWRLRNSCNCGVLFCALTGKTPDQLSDLHPVKQASWSELVSELCPITGVTTDKLFVSLFNYGLTPKDIVNLEFLKDARVLDQIPESGKPFNCSHKEDVIQYMRTWADLLTEEGRLDQVETVQEDATDHLLATIAESKT